MILETGSPSYIRMWRTDGTRAGTSVVDLPRGFTLSLNNAGGRLVYASSDPSTGSQLFSTDGTAANTTPFAPVVSYSNPTSSGELVYFLSWRPDGSGQVLWRTDGTGSGTSPLIEAASITSLIARPDASVRFVVPGADGSRLWSSDGSVAGTVPLAELPAGAMLFPSSGSTLFFSANDPSTGTELWVTDGTQGGTHLVRDIAPGGLGSNPASLVNLGRVAVFAASDGVHGNELWRTDGTDEGTSMIQDLAPEADSSSPGAFLEGCGGIVYFTADAGLGPEPFAIPLSAVDSSARSKPCPVTAGASAPVRPRPRP